MTRLHCDSCDEVVQWPEYLTNTASLVHYRHDGTGMGVAEFSIRNVEHLCSRCKRKLARQAFIQMFGIEILRENPDEP